ncbi:Histone-lysine N-methyltransferase [Venturia nashicola]|uniref:Histone-lysine N-methyltransferase n=1 Tax=Venturia nashicola TaxID=86259 RepID=A0A4Z1PEP5_9PEZI|nr:Histone-lysine N-methyltransferase [Venturia nashicola]TLD31726.1 Histone-lysine N-methyltransferase [Venturia nashicola]
MKITGNKDRRMNPKDDKTGLLERTLWTWYPKTRLGQGACGHATLWVEANDEGIVGGSVVAKDVNFETEWDSRIFSDDPSPKGTLPVFILPYMGFHVHKALRSFRLLTDHAPYGDLFDFVQKFPLPNPKEMDKDKPETEQDMIPVAYRPPLQELLEHVQAAVDTFPGPPSKEDYDLVHSKKRKKQSNEEMGDRYDHKDTLRAEKLRKLEREKGI